MYERSRLLCPPILVHYGCEFWSPIRPWVKSPPVLNRAGGKCPKALWGLWLL